MKKWNRWDFMKALGYHMQWLFELSIFFVLLAVLGYILSFVS